MPGLASLFSARSTLEDPSIPLSQASDELFDLFGASPSKSGERVTESTAMQYSAFFRGLVLVSRDIGKTPVDTFVREGEGRTKDKEHPAYNILRHRANPDTSAVMMKTMVIVDAIMKGNHYSWIERKGNGKPVAQWRLDPSRTFPVRENGVLFYAYTDLSGRIHRLDSSDVFHIPGFSFDGVMGISILQMARQALGRALAVQTYGSLAFKNGLNASVLLEHPETLSEGAKTNLRKTWGNEVGGDNRFGVKVIEEGMKAKTLAWSASDAQLIQTDEMLVRQMANYLGVPPHKVGDTTRSSFASIEAEQLAYLAEALDPWMVVIEAEYREKFLSTEEKKNDTHFVEFNRKALVRTDTKTMFENLRIALGGTPFFTRNQALKMLNENPVQDGDILPEPVNMDFVHSALFGVPPKEPTSDGGDGGARTATPESREAAKALLEDICRRMIHKVCESARRKSKNDETFRGWLTDMPEEHRRDLEFMCRPVADAARQLSGATIGASTLTSEIIDRLQTDFRYAIETPEYRDDCKGSIKKLTAAYERDMHKEVAAALLDTDDETEI